jgi:hypothetical protein
MAEISKRDTRKRCKVCGTVLLFDRPWCKTNGRHHGNNGALCDQIKGLEHVNRRLSESLSGAQQKLLAAGIAR